MNNTGRVADFLLAFLCSSNAIVNSIQDSILNKCNDEI
jgi:hypothetical protein